MWTVQCLLLTGLERYVICPLKSWKKSEADSILAISRLRIKLLTGDTNVSSNWRTTFSPANISVRGSVSRKWTVLRSLVCSVAQTSELRSLGSSSRSQPRWAVCVISAFQAAPTGRRPRGKLTTCCRDYVCCLAQERPFHLLRLSPRQHDFRIRVRK